jgi:antitoxin MazE
VKARLVSIGNSRGIRLPKSVIEEAQLGDEVELKAEPGCIIIRSAKPPRTGWAEAAKRMHQVGDDQSVMPEPATHFEEQEWQWR